MSNNTTPHSDEMNTQLMTAQDYAEVHGISETDVAVLIYNGKLCGHEKDGGMVC